MADEEQQAEDRVPSGCPSSSRPRRRSPPPTREPQREMNRMQADVERERQQFQEILAQQQQQFESLRGAAAGPAAAVGARDGEPARRRVRARLRGGRPGADAAGGGAVHPAAADRGGRQADGREAVGALAADAAAAGVPARGEPAHGGGELRRPDRPRAVPAADAGDLERALGEPELAARERHRRGLRGGDRQRRQARPARLARQRASRRRSRSATRSSPRRPSPGRAGGSVYTEDEQEAMRQRIRNADNTSYAQLRQGNG